MSYELYDEVFSTRRQRSYPTDPDPTRATQALQDIADAHAGWKLHLNFDTDNTNHRSTVTEALDSLRQGGHIYTYKIGHGGGKASGQPGKEATAYVGSRDRADVAAQIIGYALDPVLDPAEDTVLKDDQPFGCGDSKVWGRFDISRYDKDFHQYGAAGIPFLTQDMDIYNPSDPVQAAARASGELVLRYGEFFSGTGRMISCSL